MSPELARILLDAALATLTMVAAAAALATLIGLPLGVFLATSGRGELFAAPGVGMGSCGDQGEEDR